MKEIKFRVRDLTSKEVIGYEFINFTSDVWHYLLNEKIVDEEGNIDYVSHNGSIECPLDKSYRRELYTGLKDKNGVEIYEGDIVKHAPYYPIDIAKDKDAHIIQICDLIEFFKIVGYNENERVYDYLPENLEKIGTIYENPELLEAK